MSGSARAETGVRPLRRMTRALLHLIPLREAGFEIALVLTIIMLLWGSIVTQLVEEKRAAIEGASTETKNLALAFEQNIDRTIGAIDQTLHFVRSAYLKDPNLDLQAWYKANSIDDALNFQIAIIDAKGMLRASSLGPITHPVDLSDRQHFRVHLGAASDSLYISKPVTGRESHKWSVQFTRAIIGPNGVFHGVVVVSCDPYLLSSFYDAADIPRFVVTVIGEDGVVRARAPNADGMIGRVLTLRPWVLHSKQGTMIDRSPLDGKRRILSFRHVDRYPLIVGVGIDIATVFKSYRADKQAYVIAGLVLTALILIVAALLGRQRKRTVHSQRVLQDTLEHVGQGIIMIDEQRRAAVINRRAGELLGLPASLLHGRSSFDDIVRWLTRSGEMVGDGRHPGLRREGMAEAIAGVEAGFTGYEKRRPNGTVLEVRTNTLPDGGAVRTYTDITERKRAEDRIRFLAHHDALTGLANRAALAESLQAAFREAAACERQLSVLCLDLDRFKMVNDVRGHHVGDQLLIQVASRIRELARPDDVVARVGGDEFVLLHPDGDAAEAADFASRLVATLSRPFEVGGQISVIGSSVGLARYPADGATPELLLQHADLALYAAKEEGGNCVRAFNAAMHRQRDERYQLEQDLRLALRDDLLELHYQPVCDARTREIRGFEALLRWTHPVHGAIPPSDFIPLAEECGLILPLGVWVLQTACREAAKWPADVRLSVNLSPAQFRQRNLPEQIAAVLRETGLAGRRLSLEITEGLLIEDTDRVAATIVAIRKLGIQVSLDDFGTGHASLSYLRRIPFDTIKIDRSFVEKLGQDEEALALLEAIVILSRALRLRIVAEGVETEQQFAVLRSLGCDLVQGYLLGRPAAAQTALRAVQREAVETR